MDAEVLSRKDRNLSWNSRISKMKKHARNEERTASHILADSISDILVLLPFLKHQQTLFGSHIGLAAVKSGIHRVVRMATIKVIY